MKTLILVTALFADGFSVATAAASNFKGAKAGDDCEVAGMRFCWCPPGKFMMGSPRTEPERRPDEDHVREHRQGEVPREHATWSSFFIRDAGGSGPAYFGFCFA